MDFLEELLDTSSLPAYLNRDPSLSQGITVQYSGTSGTMSIIDGAFSTAINGGSGADLSIDLTTGISLTTLVADINASTGYTATLLGAGNAGALTLVKTNNVDIVTSVATVPVFNSLLYKVLQVFAIQLAAVEANANAAFDELIVFKADGQWVDQWGNEYGVPRLLGENDATYAERIIQEITRNRLNGLALEDAVEAEARVQVDISSKQTDIIKIVGKSNVGQNILVDRQHEPAQFIVSGISETNVGSDPAVTTVINRNRAAGVNPIYNYTTPPFSGAFIGVCMFDVSPIAPSK